MPSVSATGLTILLALILFLAGPAGRADDPHNPSHGQPGEYQPASGPAPTSTLLLQSVTTGDGLPLVYPAGQAQVTARVVEIPPGGETGRHRHPVPLFAYILEGEVTVQVDGQPPRHFKAGEALVEVAAWHNGLNPGPVPVRILAVYLGAEGLPLAVKP